MFYPSSNIHYLAIISISLYLWCFIGACILAWDKYALSVARYYTSKATSFWGFMIVIALILIWPFLVYKTLTQPKVTMCPKCKGAGKVEEAFIQLSSATISDVVPCGMCGGTGSFKR